MVTITFITHATSLDNEAGLASGHYDVELSPLGEKQARELGVRYAVERIDAVFCSDLQRSYRTGELAFTGRGIPIIRDARLRECDYGVLTRHRSAEVESQKLRFISEPFPNGESYQQAAARLRSFLEDLLLARDGEQVMIIGHRATYYGLEHRLRGVPLAEAISAPWVWQPGWRYELTADPRSLGDEP